MTSNLKSPSSPTQMAIRGAGIEAIHLSDPPDMAAAPVATDEELERFRLEWEREVKARRAIPADRGILPAPGSRDRQQSPRSDQQRRAGTSDTAAPNSRRDSSPLKARSPLAPSRALPPDLDAPAGPSWSIATPTAPVPIVLRSEKERPRSSAPDKGDAVALYSRAVEAEQSGMLNEALMLYRRAFKLDDNVDRLYARSLVKAAQSQAQGHADLPHPPSGPSSADIVSPHIQPDEPYSFQRHIQLQPDYEKHPAPLHPAGPGHSETSVVSRPSLLTALLRALPIPPDQTRFLPADEVLPIPIASLPTELLDPVLHHLDVGSIERFGATCWRARYLTAGAGVWRRIVEGVYRGPGMMLGQEARAAGGVDRGGQLQGLDEAGGGNAEDEDADSPCSGREDREELCAGKTVQELARRHAGEWRTTLVEEERVRMDGCYISVCHYIRPGAGDQWVAITHMITYHRFLRFYPDGSVISFLTTDHPSEVVPLLRPSLRSKGLHFGRWRLLRSDAQPVPPLLPTDPPDGQNDMKYVKDQARGRSRARILITDLLEPGLDGPKYEFEMELSLRETGRGKWNKLDILRYHSINLATGESLALSLKHQKPFYFSKVRSYHPQL